MPGSEGRGSERGSILILALLFMTVTGVLLVPVSGLVTNALRNTTNLNSQMELEYAANGATELAVQAVRYEPNYFNSFAPCLPNGATSITIGAAPSMEVYCTGVENIESTATRTVTFSTCASSDAPASCSAAPILLAIISFNDFSLSNKDTCSIVPLQVTSCGTGMTIVSWVVETANQ